MADVLFRTSTSHTSFFDRKDDCGSPLKKSFSFNHSASSSQTSSTHSTSTSSLSLETSLDDLSSDDDTLAFPSYGNSPGYRDEEESEAPPSSPIVSNLAVSHVAPSPSEATTLVATPDPLPPISEDDTAVRPEPSHHVDYLSHDWIEEDIWASWRHIVEHRRVYGECSRLENASWRTWAKQQFKLKTTSPESLNWLKDVDITWLYGPLQPAANRSSGPQTSTPSSRLSKTNSFLHKKPILKKRSMSEVMLQKSISSSSLVKEAAAAVQAQQASGITLERRRRPIIGRATSDFAPSTTPFQTISRSTTDFFSSSQSSSGLQTPDTSEKKHIRFDEKVEQCIAVECKGADDEDEDDFNNQNPWAKYSESSDSSDEGVVMMKKSRKKRPLSRTNSKTNISGDSKTIAKLPSTTLKYRTDSPDISDQQQHHSLGFWRSSRLSPSPSQETLRPSNPSANFLLPDEDEEGEENHFTFGVKRSSTPTHESEGGLRRTASGMFMPFEDEGEEPAQPGLIGKVVDTVNTARDIAHVIWNVGWRN